MRKGMHVSGGGINAFWGPCVCGGYAATLGVLDGDVSYDVARKRWRWDLWRGTVSLAFGWAATSRAAMVAAQEACLMLESTPGGGR